VSGTIEQRFAVITAIGRKLTPQLQFLCDIGAGVAFSALTLLVGRQEGHLACKKEWWGAGVVVCLELGADLHMAKLMPLPLAVSCFSKIPIGFTFLVPAHMGSPGKRAFKWVCVVLAQVVSSRLDGVKKTSELAELRIAADEAVKVAETADSEQRRMQSYFDQEIHSVRKSYEDQV